MNANIITYTLPACWASYLINGDASGLDVAEQVAVEKFVEDRDLPAPVSCSDESWFARSNDASRLGGDVLEYTFLIHAPATPAFEPGQCAVYTEADGTTRSVTIRSVNENVVRIHWFSKRGFLTGVPLSHAAARECLVLFPPGEKFMVLEGGAK